MKKTSALLALTALVALPMAAAPVLAKGGNGHGPSFETLDLNGDGSITADEIAGQQAARFAAADTDGDGVLSVEELQTAADAKAQQRKADRMARMITQLDTDGDGALSLDEIEAGRKDRGNRGDAEDRGERMFQHLDANDDGVIDAEEFAAHQSDRGGKGPRDKRDHDRGGFWR